MEFTEMELKVLEDITKDDFYECDLDSALRTDYFIEGQAQEHKKVRETLSSLVKKNILLPIAIIKGRDGIIAFSKFGKDVMIKLGYK